MIKQTKEAYDTTLHNFKKHQEATKPEEGVDSFILPDNMHDPMALNVKKLEREVKNQMKILHLDRPQVAARHLEFLSSKDTDLDYEMSQPPIPVD
jgi:hypothetical protein